MTQPDRNDSHELQAFFRPKSVAVVGATERVGHVGRAVLWNLVSSPFGGTVYPVNPQRKAVLGLRAYRSVSELPECPELVVVVTPAETVPQIVRECAEAGVRGAIVISAGFRESGAEGLRLEQEMLAAARGGRIRLLGPNCLGMMLPPTGLNATFAAGIARPGNVALISQSGAICTALLDWSLREQVGFSAVISVGSMIDIGWGDLIDYLGSDRQTRSIVLYMESVGDARAFLSAAREVALTKPILVIKAGRTAVAAKAAASHTGSMVGSDAVLDAALRRVGVLRLASLGEVFEMTGALARQPRPSGPRLTIITNAGGPAVLATDALIELGSELAPLSAEAAENLDRKLPAHWSHRNPIDLLGDAGPDRYDCAVQMAAHDPGTDGVLVIMTPQAMSDPVAIAQTLVPYAHLRNEPMLASWMGGERAGEGEEVLKQAGIPTFAFPDSAARVFHNMWRYSYNLGELYQTPEANNAPPDASARAAALIEQIRQADRTLLTETESKQLLGFYGIPTVETHAAATAEEAAKVADDIGYPVVVKMHSLTVTHKSDVGGVKLSLRDAGEVRNAYREIEQSVISKVGEGHFHGVTVQRMIALDGVELIVGASVDEQFGPVLMFGAGGQLVEVFEDRALALPPLNSTLARRLMEQTRIAKALSGVRGRKAANTLALEGILVRFSQLASEQVWIREIDVNPLLAAADAVLALDARVILYGRDVQADNIPKRAIRPYPAQYAKKLELRDGTVLQVSPICPEDEPEVMAFHRRLSDESVYRRYFSPMSLETRIQHERLTRMCFIDYDRQMALVAKTAGGEIAGIGRLIKTPGGRTAEVAILVSDAFQHRGLGTDLVSRLVNFARDEKLKVLTASFLGIIRQWVSSSAAWGFRIARAVSPTFGTWKLL